MKGQHFIICWDYISIKSTPTNILNTKLRKQELKHSKHTHMKRVHYSMLM